MDKELQEFKSHHRNKFNILFHVFCGFIYTALFFHLLGGWYSILLYTIVVILMYPKLTGLFIVMFAILILLDGVFENTKLQTREKIIMLVVFYMLPEISHWITHEKTVLTIGSIDLFSLVKNFFLLLPYSLMSLL
jgi:hypothetical protein